MVGLCAPVVREGARLLRLTDRKKSRRTHGRSGRGWKEDGRKERERERSGWKRKGEEVGSKGRGEKSVDEEEEKVVFEVEEEDEETHLPLIFILARVAGLNKHLSAENVLAQSTKNLRSQGFLFFTLLAHLPFSLFSLPCLPVAPLSFYLFSFFPFSSLVRSLSSPFLAFFLFCFLSQKQV